MDRNGCPKKYSETITQSILREGTLSMEKNSFVIGRIYPMDFSTEKKLLLIKPHKIREKALERKQSNLSFS